MAKATRNRPTGKTVQAPQRTSAPRQVRIIGGQWKRTPLPVLDAQGLRPTPDRVRETVFNWLHHLLDGRWGQARCLDLFAGSGALGLEAASRGASYVVLVEADAAATRQLEATVAKLRAESQVTVLRADAGAAAQRLAMPEKSEEKRFDVIFLDPPYHQGWLEKMLPLCQRLLSDHGVVYAESERPLSVDDDANWLAGWEIVRSDRAGVVFYHLLQRKIGFEIQA